MKSVPIKVEHGGKWVPTAMGIAEDRFRIDAPLNQEIPYRSVVDLDEKKNQVIITAGVDEEAIYRIASVEKVLQILKKLIVTQANAYRLNVFFMSPAIRGGALIQNAQWEKGTIAVMKTGIWFISQESQICIPLDEVTDIELTSREIQEKSLDVVKIDYLTENEPVTSFVFCPLATLQVLYDFLREATHETEIYEEIDPLTGQAAMLVYSGMDSSAIENMLKLSHKDLDAIYEKLLGSGLAEVLYVRREVQLTPKGVRYISKSEKSSIS